MKNLYPYHIIFIVLLTSLIYPQNRAILHIGADGQQELARLIDKAEIMDVINQLHAQKDDQKHANDGAIIAILDTFAYYPEWLQDSMVRLDPLDIAFQWFAIGGELDVVGILWRNGDLDSDSKMGQVRVWRADLRLHDLPNTAVNSTGHLGYYEIDCDSCDHEITAYKEESGFGLQTMGNQDTTHLYFDPLGVEWQVGRTDVIVDSGEWQIVNFEEELYFREMEPFGFSIQNKTPVSQQDSSLWIWSAQLADYDSTEFFNPYRSMKFYTYPFGEDSTIGWQIRNWEWGIYVIVDLHQDGPYVHFYFLDDEMVIPSDIEKEISIILDDHNDENPGFPEVRMVEAMLKYKIGHAPVYQTILMNISGDTLSGSLPPLPADKDIFMYAVVYDDMGMRYHTQVESYSTISAINNQSIQPFQFRLEQNYPNPFNPVTAIRYRLSAVSDVDFSIYNLIGQKVATLVSGKQAAGLHQSEWDASEYPSGIYYYRLHTDTFSETKKMVLLR